MAIDDFDIVTTTAGALSIRNKVVGEIMHNPIGPWAESNALYIDQSRLRERLAETNVAPFELFDVGLGAASNAIAAIDAALKLPTKSTTRMLNITSFENNLDLLRFTLLHTSEFPHLQNYSDALASILHKRSWESPCRRVTWSLIEGDFNRTIPSVTKTPNLIFFDPYSPSVNQDMWTLDCFTRLRAKCYKDDSGESTCLFTYSVSTPIRSALLLAGFYVGYGLPIGLKEATTQASTQLSKLHSPLGQEWFGRWSRSHRKLPYDSAQFNNERLLSGIQNHVQFRH